MKRLDEMCMKAIEKWGARSQIEQAEEELAELIVALKHHKRGKNDIEDVAEEIADVKIMLRQLEIMFNVVESELIDETVVFKLDRIESKINEL